MKERNYSVQANDWLFYLRVTRDKVLSKYLTAILIIHSFSFQKRRWSLQQYFMNLSYYNCRHTKFKHSTVQISNQNGVDFDPFHCNRVRCFLLSALSGLCFGKMTSHLSISKTWGVWKSQWDPLFQIYIIPIYNPRLKVQTLSFDFTPLSDKHSSPSRNCK